MPETPAIRQRHPPSARSMLLIAGGIFSVAAVAGMIWLDGFASNIVAELAGMAGSVVVAVLIVEVILDRRREEEWALVRDQLARSGRGLGQLAAFDIHLALPPDVRRTIPSPAVLPAGGHAQMLDRLAGELDQYVTTYDDNTAHMHPIQLHDICGSNRSAAAPSWRDDVTACRRRSKSGETCRQKCRQKIGQNRSRASERRTRAASDRN